MRLDHWIKFSVSLQKRRVNSACLSLWRIWMGMWILWDGTILLASGDSLHRKSRLSIGKIILNLHRIQSPPEPLPVFVAGQFLDALHWKAKNADAHKTLKTEGDNHQALAAAADIHKAVWDQKLNGQLGIGWTIRTSHQLLLRGLDWMGAMLLPRLGTLAQ